MAGLGIYHSVVVLGIYHRPLNLPKATRRCYHARLLQGVALLHARLLDARLLHTRMLDARLLDARLLDARLLHTRMLDARLLDARMLDARLLEGVARVETVPGTLSTFGIPEPLR